MKRKYYNYAQAFVVNFLIAFIVFGYYMLKEKGLFTLTNDFNTQTIPFTKLTLDAIHEQGGLWNWHIDLGTNLISSMSITTLGSPVFWLFSWCKGENVLYIIGWQYIIKYAIMGVTSYAYLIRYTSKHRTAMIGSVLYAFSGFQTVNLIFFIFFDAVAFFPLLLIAFEEMMEKDKKYWFAACVALNAFVNYYTFVGEVVFLILYYIVRYFVFDWKRSIRKLGQCITEGIWGILMAAALFIPSIFNILRTSRIQDNLGIAHYFDFNRRDMLQVFAPFVFPSETMMGRSYIREEDWTSRAAYLPMIGIIFVVIFLFQKHKEKWLKAMLCVCIPLMIFPIGNGLFSLFTTIYCRWFYMPILLMILASLKAIEDAGRRPVVILAGLMCAFFGAIYVFFGWWDKNKFQLIFNKEAFTVIWAMALTGIICVLLIYCIKCKQETRERLLFLGVALFAVITTSYTCNQYQKNDGKDSFYLADEIGAIVQLEAEEGYRYSTQEINQGMLGQFANANTFISTITGSIPEFWNSLGEDKILFSPIGPEGAQELLSMRYIISKDIKEEYLLIDTLTSGQVTYYLYELPQYLRIGFTYTEYMLKSDFFKLNSSIRAKVMLKALVIEDEDEELMPNGMTRLMVDDVDSMSEESIKDLISLHSSENSEKFTIASDMFSCTIHSDAEKYAFFSVPYDRGWSASVNGQETTILNINGLMAVPVMPGENNIVFTYEDKVFKCAVGVSLLFIGLWIYRMKKRDCRG
ncbi:MAG: hypothetical protein E7290_06550 [Lachnospiraceae bacterium]|nr:hypothetical protein [Lachnospiraceae bacterium]